MSDAKSPYEKTVPNDWSISLELVLEAMALGTKKELAIPPGIPDEIAENLQIINRRLAELEANEDEFGRAGFKLEVMEQRAENLEKELEETRKYHNLPLMAAFRRIASEGKRLRIKHGDEGLEALARFMSNSCHDGKTAITHGFGSVMTLIKRIDRFADYVLATTGKPLKDEEVEDLIMWALREDVSGCHCPNHIQVKGLQNPLEAIRNDSNA